MSILAQAALHLGTKGGCGGFGCHFCSFFQLKRRLILMQFWTGSYQIDFQCCGVNMFCVFETTQRLTQHPLKLVQELAKKTNCREEAPAGNTCKKHHERKLAVVASQAHCGHTFIFAEGKQGRDPSPALGWSPVQWSAFWSLPQGPQLEIQTCVGLVQPWKYLMLC